MKNRWIFLLMALLLSFSGVAQNSYILPVGNGTNTQNSVPSYMYYGNSVTQAIYHQSDINLSGEITSISWHPTGSSWGTRTWAVYLGETALDLFSGQSDLLTAEQLTEVYNGSVTTGADGWITIQLTTPFTYSNESNLVIAVFDNTNSWTSSYPNYTSTTFSSGISYYAYRDNTPYTSPTDANNAGSTVPNIRLGITSEDTYCEAPTTVSLVSAEEDALTITWNELDGVTGYVAQCKLPSEDWEDAIEISVSDNEATFTGLTASTAYNVRVQNDCGSSWVSGTFRTACGLVTELPYIMTFEDADGAACMQSPVTATYSDGRVFPLTTLSSNIAHNGSQGAMEFMAGNIVTAFPATQEDVTNLRLKFFARCGVTQSNAGTVEVGYLTDISDPASFVNIETIPFVAQGQYNMYSVSFAGAEPGSRMAMRYTSVYTTTSWYFDDVEIDYLPSCVGPAYTSLTGSVQYDEAYYANLTWSDPVNSAWRVYYKTATENEYTEYEDVTSTSASIAVNPSSTYSFYVVSLCNGEESADATATISLSIPGLPLESLPYEQDFENPEEITEFTITGSGANQWAIGSAAFNPGEEGAESGNALYISNDNGVTNAYTNNNTSISYATLIVPFNEQLEYHLSFDFKCVAESGNYDYLKVFMLDATQDLSTSSLPSSGAITPNLNMINNWTHYDYTLTGIQAGDVKKIVFAWRNDGSIGDNPPAAVDNISIIGNACAKVTNVALASAEEDAITVSWTENGTATSWDVYYKQHGSSEDYDMISASSEPTATISGLDANTQYDIYVEAICATGAAEPSDVVVLRTACGAISTLPWEEDFEGYQGSGVVSLVCWNTLQSASANNGTFPAVYAGHAPACNSGANSMELKGGNIMLGLPAFEESIENLRLTFHANTTAGGASSAGTLEVGVLTDPYDATSFVVLDTVTGESFNRNGSALVGPYDFNGFTGAEYVDAQIALRYTSYSSSTSWNLDDFVVTEIPSCPAPASSSVAFSDITSESATVSWEDNDASHTAWTVYYRAENEEEYSDINATSTSVTLTGLTDNTKYFVYIMSNCGNDDNIDKTETKQFKTTSIPVNLPYEETFESPEDVTAYVTSSQCSNSWIIGNATFNPGEEEATEGYSMYVSGDGQSFSAPISGSSFSEKTIVSAITVEFPDEPMEYHLSFDYKVGGKYMYSTCYEGFKVYLIDGSAEIVDGSVPQPRVTVLDWQHDINDWTHFDAILSDVAGTTKQIAFTYKVYEYSYYHNDTPAAVDNISIYGMTCAQPSDVTVSNITASEATVSWTENGSATSWTLYYKADTDEDWSDVPVTGEPTTNISIEANKVYSVYVTAACTGEPSAPSPTTVFHSACDVVTELPYIMLFDDEYGTECMTTPLPCSYGDRTFPLVTLATSISRNGSAGAMELLNETTGGTVVTAFPETEEDVTNLRLKLYARCNASSAANAGTLEIGYLTDVEDYNTFVALETIPYTAANQYDMYTISFAGAEQGSRMAIRWTTSYYYTSWYFDDVEIDYLPSCPGPAYTSLTGNVEYTDSYSVNLAWSDASNSAWRVYYKESTDEDYQTLDVTETSASIAVNPSSSYSFYVVALCNGEESVDATATITVNVPGLPLESLPYEQDFENPEEITEFTITGSGSNQWTIGSATFYAGETEAESGNALYISDDNGVTNNYTLTSTSISYATLIVPFNEQLEYHLSFDFKGMGEATSYTTYDYMRVFMLNADEELSTSSMPSDSKAISPMLTQISNWTHYDYTLTGIQAGSVKKIVFAWRNDYSSGTNPPAAIDNISIIGNACAKVTNVALVSAEEDAITATWQENGTATSWNVYYRQHGTGEYTMETVNDNQATFTNLEANTSYDVYVEAICEDGSFAAASDVATLRTACGAIATLPWNEDFESYPGSGVAVALQCWTNITSYTASNGTFPAVYTGYSQACHSGQNSMELKGSSNLVALPPFTEPIENLRVSFYANTTATSASSAGTLEIGVISDLSDPTSFVVLDTVTGEAFNRNGSNPVGPFDFNGMTVEEGSLIALRYNNASNSSQSWNLDDFTVTLIPSCAAPNTPTVDDITSTSATINWTDDNTEHNAWKLYYKSAAESEYTEVSVSGTTTWTLTDLSASTQYSVYLMSDCGTADNIDVTATITFATACGDVTSFPYTEGFEGGDLGCWTTEAVVGSTPWTYSSSQYNSGSHSVYFTYTTNASARLISPVFDLTSLENPTLSYAYYVRNYNGSGDSLSVYYRATAEDEWTLLGGHGDPMSAFAVDTIALPNPSATYQVMFLSLGRDALGMYLDDITVFEGENSGEQPEVVAPQVATLAATQVAQTSAVLNGTITPGTETISAQGFEYKEATAANYTTVSATGNTMTATLNNLTANTTYEYRAFATTATSTYYGSVMTFTTLTEGGEPCTPTSSTTEATICEGSSYTFNGQTYTTAGTYTATLVNAAGCDSIATLVLTVNAASTSSIEVSICSGETYEFNGQTLTTAGTYTATLQNANGCDSVVTLTLTVNVAENTQDSVSINAGETYEWNGETYSQAGTYTAEMTDENGCSYTATLVLTVNNGLTDADNLVNVTLYPNPTTSNATLNVEGVNEEAMVIVTDIQGRTIQSNKLAAGQTTMTISTESLASGVYYVRVITSNATRTEKLIKK